MPLPRVGLTHTKRKADDQSKMTQNYQKMSTFWNFDTIFGISMENAFK